MPPRIARIIDRALKPKPQDRYRSARSLAAELTGLRRRQPRVSVTLALDEINTQLAATRLAARASAQR